MNTASIADIPEDLAAEAAQVEGLQERLILWLRAEITQDKKRKSRHSARDRTAGDGQGGGDENDRL